MIESIIIDPKTGIPAEVVDGIEQNALVVATRPLKEFDNKLTFFANAEYGIDMNQDASTGGIPEEVHNGIDDVLWTATDIVGGAKTTFNSANQNHTAGGNQSVKVDNSPVNDVFQFDKGADLDCNGYVSLSLWVYVDKDWKSGDNIELYGWDTGTGLQVGDSISLQNYFTWSEFDVWQKISIPLVDMGALASYTTLDALRVQIITKEGKSPKFYLDDIQFEQTGNPITYSIEPELGTWLHLDKFMMVYADAYTGILADLAMPKIPYNSFFALSALSVGIVYQRWCKGEVVTTASIKQHSDLMSFSNATITGHGSDGVNSWVAIAITFPAEIILRPEHEDKVSFTISENLSGLELLRFSAGGKEESRLTY